MDGITDSMDMSLSKLQETVKDRSLACCSPWGRKELDMTEGLNNSNLASCTRGKTEENYKNNNENKNQALAPRFPELLI